MSILDRSESRQGAQVIWLAVHSTEGDDNPLADDARALRDADWWTGSSHAIADDEPGSLLTPAEGCVPYERAAWTLRGGNRYSDNIELVARASWSRATWLANPRLLEMCARWLADRHKARPWIPLRRLTLAEVRDHVPGVIGHVDYTNATGDGTHWDPGPNFPWDVVITRAKQIANGEDDMPTVAEFWNAKTVHPMTGKETIVIDLVKDGVRQATRAAVDGAIARKLAEAAAKGVALSQADVDRIAEAAAAEVAEDLSQGYDLTATPKTDPAA